MENQPIQQNMQAASNNIEQGYNSVKNSISQGLENFSEKVNENAEASSSFLSSNVIAKFAFIVLIIIVFVILLNLGIILLSKATGPSSNPFLIIGLELVAALLAQLHKIPVTEVLFQLIVLIIKVRD